MIPPCRIWLACFLCNHHLLSDKCGASYLGVLLTTTQNDARCDYSRHINALCTTEQRRAGNGIVGRDGSGMCWTFRSPCRFRPAPRSPRAR
jgi:hypothetical protein